jgi:hypothetical protein
MQKGRDGKHRGSPPVTAAAGAAVKMAMSGSARIAGLVAEQRMTSASETRRTGAATFVARDAG